MVRSVKSSGVTLLFCADPWPVGAPRAVEAMRQAGIPAVVNERDGYFEAQEIQLY